MSDTFDLKTNKIAIGDPCMNMVTYTLTDHSPGLYTLQIGALITANSTEDTPIIDLDNPCLFVIDDSYREEFEKWFHQIGDECAYNVFLMSERLSEAEEKFGLNIAFHWEEEICGESKEGQYSLDTTKLKISQPVN